MKNPPTFEGARRRWPLRLVLFGVLVTLVVVGVDTRHQPSAANTTSTTSSTTSSTTTTSATNNSTTTSTTTTLRPPPPPTQTAITNPLDLHLAKHGCGFSTVSATPSTSTTTSTPTTTTTTHVSVLGHCTVLEIGDSLGNDLGWGLARQLEHTPGLRLVQKDKSSSGLANSGFYDWPAHLKTYLAQYHPDLVIVCLGGNDEQGFSDAGHVVEFPTAAWASAYDARIRQIVNLITRAHSYVLWVGMPIMEPTQYREGMVVLNRQYQTVATSVPGVTFLPSWDLFANAEGQFQMAAQIGPTRQILRSSDGIHFSLAGENVFSTYVTNQISAIYHVKLVPDDPTYIKY